MIEGPQKHCLGGEVAPPHAPLATQARGIRRVRALAPGARDLARIVYRDPEHVPERITLKTIERLAESSLAWAQAIRAERPEVEPAVMAEELRHQSATVARIDGAIAGTPFFIAIVPGYLGYLWQEAMMVLRTAALYDHDPRQLTTAAETLSLRGVHPSPEAALAALEAVLAKPLPDKPPRRRTLRNWVQSIRMLLVFGGFLSPPNQRSQIGRQAKLLTVAGLLLATIVFVITWVFPVTFIVAMAWGRESHTQPRTASGRVLRRRGNHHTAGDHRLPLPARRRTPQATDDPHPLAVPLRSRSRSRSSHTSFTSAAQPSSKASAPPERSSRSPS